MTLARQSKSLLLLASALTRPTIVSAFIPGSSSLSRAANNRASATITATTTSRRMFGSKKKYAEPCVMGDESLMSPKAHGTSATPVQTELRWGCDYETADRICNYNRHYAEYAGYWTTTSFVTDAKSMKSGEEITFYDSNTGKALFVAPRGRDMDAFLKESASHGWPSFRDEEVVWDSVRCLDNGEAVSVDGTHLGHNLPDGKGNRYCINLVSVAGKPEGGGKL